MAKKYFWLKLRENFFMEKEIKKMRRVAGGDTYALIYLKMMLLSLQNEGHVFYDGVEDDFASEIALEIDEDIENVKMTLLYLEKVKLLEVLSQNEIFLTKLPECVGCETDSAERKRRQREKNVTLSQENVTLSHDSVTLSHECHNESRLCHTEIEKEKEKEKEQSRVDESKPILPPPQCEFPDAIEQELPHEDEIRDVVMKLWNAQPYTKKLQIIPVMQKRYRDLMQVIHVYGYETLLKEIRRIPQIEWFKKQGEVKFDWYIDPNNFIKVLEGNYDKAFEKKEMSDLERIARNNRQVFIDEGMWTEDDEKDFKARWGD